MRLHRLTLTAFGPFADSQSVDFDELSSAGLFLLHGPTGAGKTSVLDGVCFALYGGVPGSRTAARLRSDHADPETMTEVVLELTVGGRRLEITRRPEQLRPKKRGRGMTPEKAVTLLREHTGGAWRALSKSHQEVGEELLRLIGMSKEQFCQVVLLPQGEFAGFLRAGVAERAALLGRLFDTSRFKAVEDWLRDRRRASEQRIRTGDEELLNLAHRIQQEAGEGAEPPQDWAAGEPDLAERILAWAAVLRCGAREQAAVARLALDTAEAAHTEAQHQAQAVRELYALQQRHAAAVRRAAALAAVRPEREGQLARLERARRAAAVEPALELREKAAREHTAAQSAERAARAGLPEGLGLAEAGAAQLTEYENRQREELGALTEAGRAEQQAAEAAAERGSLEREARGAEQLVADADAWLEGWDGRREALRQRLDDAQTAALHAGELTAVRDRARRRLEAAQARDWHAGALQGAEDRLRTARDATADAREAWHDTREARIAGIAAELAAELHDGHACLVCGSDRHPAPARPSARQVTADDEDRAQGVYQRAQAVQSEAQDAVSRAVAALEAARAEVGQTPLAELVAAHAVVDREYAEATATAAGARPAREALDRAEAEHTRRLADRQHAATRIATLTAHREGLDLRHADLTAQLTRARGPYATVADRRTALAADIARSAEAARAVRTANDTAQRVKEADARLADAAYRAGFDTPEAAAAALLPDDEARRLREDAEQWQREEAAVTADLTALDLSDAAALPPADPDQAARTAEAANRRLQHSAARDAAALDRCAELDRLGARAATRTTELAPARADHARLRRLADLAAGTSGENQLRMELETYVLAARLEQVAAAASLRLLRMSSGRYTLVHTDAKASRGSRSGLGLLVLDSWTGTARDTATLSGGETFFASLALALGLADVVTDEAGGMRLDTLFIDEGFGSLDEQTLDEVLDVLDALRERDRAVGIVSHVADLRQRIPVQLQLLKGRLGSTLRQRTAAER